MAIVLVIVSLLIGGMMVPLSAQKDIQKTSETQKQLSDIRDALLGFVAAQGRLPCPASPGTTGTEAPVGGSACTNPWDGFVPAITLGISPTDEQGYSTDAWGNRIRYAVTTKNSNAFTTGNGIKSNWTGTLDPDIQVCSTSTGLTGSGATATCAAGAGLSSTVPAIIVSTGKNGGAVPVGDEAANTNTDRAFVNHMQNDTFDDIVIWISPNILYDRLISVGGLP